MPSRYVTKHSSLFQTTSKPPVMSTPSSLTSLSMITGEGCSSEIEPNSVSPSLPAHLSHSPLTNQKVSAPFQFGSRRLVDPSSVYEFNAWDHVAPSAADLSYAEAQYASQRMHPVSTFDATRFNANPERWWNKFYTNNTANFFKDRKWLQQEFPVLTELTSAQDGRGSEARILEVGAGAGNTAFPILKANQNPNLMIYACDFSVKAVNLIRASADYDERFIQAEVWDVSSETLPPNVTENSIDVVLLIFVFSALSPRQWQQAVKNVYRVLKPGGEVCFRDYGRGDLAQVRFRKGRYMEENFYVRGDGTRVYFFAEEQLRSIWGGIRAVAGEFIDGNDEDRLAGEHSESNEGFNEVETNAVETNEMETRTENSKSLEGSNLPVFDILSLGVDRRLLVNRQKQLCMHRCWMQGRFRKPIKTIIP